MLGLDIRKIISTVSAAIMLMSSSLPYMPVNAQNSPAQITEQAAENETQLLRQSFELYPNEEDTDKVITLDGLMPEGAEAEAVDVSDEYDGFAAYDITITDGEDEFQPVDGEPIAVEIADPAIREDSELELWHIKDNGDREQVNDFTVEDGKVSFLAEGFSVYELVYDKQAEFREYGLQIADTIERVKAHGSEGFKVALVPRSKLNECYYLTGGAIAKVTDNNDRYGLTATGNKTITELPEEAATFYFIADENSENKFYIYTLDGDTPMYVKSATVSANAARGSLNLVADENEKSLFTLEPTNSGLTCRSEEGHYWNRNTKASGAGSIVGYNVLNDNNLVFLNLMYDCGEMPDDPYDLDNAAYGLIDYNSGAYGNALMAESSAANKLDSLQVLTKVNPLSHNGVNLVAENSSITEWTFENVGKDIYYISAMVDGEKKYLSITASGAALSDTPSQIQVIPGSGANSGKVKLVSAGRTLTYASSAFSSAENKGTAGVWLNLAEPSKLLTSDDFVIYSAEKVSVSDKERVNDKSKVVIYTRVWNDAQKAYEFYAVDHNGSLVPCYERGDDIMWVGSKINTLEWDLTVYTNADGSETNYYELYNPYSGKYIAPQIKNGQILSDSKIGINLRGRTGEGYYTDILAWDEDNYAYAGLKSDVNSGKIVSSYIEEAETYYFAILKPESSSLTKVDTVDNNEYGITMKMIDFSNETYMKNMLKTDIGYQPSIPTQDLLSSDIKENGYPDITNNAGVSLADMYSGATTVNHLFIQSIYDQSGYFEFDSCQNFATLMDTNTQYPAKDGETNFTVYRELGTVEANSKSTLLHGQFLPYNTISEETFSTLNPLNLYSALALPTSELQGVLPENDPRKYERLYTVGSSPNYQNGMEMGASFVQTPSGKDAWGHDVIFEFTGDDDFWFYVDDELVIDLGGNHSALAGTVNFSTGEVVVNNNKTTLRDIFYNNFLNRGHTAAEAQKYVDDIFEKNEDNNYVFKDYSPHTMKVYYMERGGGASNLHMRFNLSYVKPGQVMMTKEVSVQDDQGNNINTDLDFNVIKYPYQIYYKVDGDDDFRLLESDDEHVSVEYLNPKGAVTYKASYRPPTSNVTYEHVYFLHPGRSVAIDFPDDTMEYYIKECALNSDVYKTVKCNDEVMSEDNDGNDDPDHKGYKTVAAQVSERPNIVLNNVVDPDGLRTLRFRKELYDENNNKLYDDSTSFNFRLYMTNEYSSELQAANMHKYYVKDPYNNYCTWDAEKQLFVSTGKNDLSSFTEEEKKRLTFNTSMYGSVSKIPAWYTVEVPDLLTGTKFRVDERDYEVPLGYKLSEYVCIEGDNSLSYTIDEGDPVNEGRIKKTESPNMAIRNKRGWEIQAEKSWSDKDFTTSHDPIFTAVYAKGELVAGTVKAITDSSPSVRYFFDDLKEGCTLDDYEICEVELTGAAVAEDGTVTYSSISKKLSDGDLTTVGAVSSGKTTKDTFSYAVSYDKGEAKSSSGEEGSPVNIREDKITNTRQGGIVVTLYDMKTREPLAGGTFTLKLDEEALGTFTSDKNGRVTILYDFERGKDYKLTETEPPSGYISLPNTAVFTIASDDTVTISGNEEKWENAYKSDVTGDQLVAYIDIYNMQFELKALKIDSGSKKGIAGAHFALYKGAMSSDNKILKDYFPMEGYEDLVSGANGVIPKIDKTLPVGTYYLTEAQAPDNYEALDKDIVFTISSLGTVTMGDPEQESWLRTDNSDGKISCVISAPNSKGESFADLTVTKSVTGIFGSKNKQFTFKLDVEGAAAADSFAWSKNGTAQDEPLSSGDTFRLKHGDRVTITLPADAEVTVTEQNEDYDTTFRLGSAEAVETDELTFTLSEDTTLAVTNDKNGILPTGVDISDIVTAALLVGMTAYGAVLLKLRKRRKAAALS